VARHSRHGIEHPLVADAARAQLSVDHALAQGREYGGVVGGTHSGFGNFHPAEAILFLASSNANIEADHAVLVARPHNRDIGIDVVFALNNLLRTLRDVGAVTEGDVIGKLLLDGDCGPRAVGLVSVVSPCGSILIRLTPKSFCMRLLTVELIAWLMIRALASSLNKPWPDCCCNCSDSSLVRPRASNAMMSDLGSGGSER